MNLDFIIWIVALMVFYDFSVHVISLFKWHNRFLLSKSVFSYYYPHLRYKKVEGGFLERPNWSPMYERFWTTYWGVAFVLLVVYLVLG